MEVLERIARVVEELDCKAVLIGSTAEEGDVPASDVDVLVICRELPESTVERAVLKARIEGAAGVPPVSNVYVELVAEKLARYYLKKARARPSE